MFDTLHLAAEQIKDTQADITDLLTCSLYRLDGSTVTTQAVWNRIKPWFRWNDVPSEESSILGLTFAHQPVYTTFTLDPICISKHVNPDNTQSP